MDTTYERYLACFSEALERACDAMAFRPSVLLESMKYALLAGGKRIRPVLFFAVLDALGHDYREETTLAVALECIHTYSLVHDDLPALDDASYRRGKPSCHAVFGEANAVLAGDALLSYAFDLLLGVSEKSERHARAARILSRAAGAEGMVAGQSADLYHSTQRGEAVSCEEALHFIYEKKTGCLLSAPLEMAAVLAGKWEEGARAFGKAFGTLFQITDDLLDVKGDALKVGKQLGRDADAGKLTCISVYGEARSEELADVYAEECERILSQMDGDPSFLCALVHRVRARGY